MLITDGFHADLGLRRKFLVQQLYARKQRDDIKKGLEDVTWLCVLEGLHNQKSLVNAERILNVFGQVKDNEITDSNTNSEEEVIVTTSAASVHQNKVQMSRQNGQMVIKVPEYPSSEITKEVLAQEDSPREDMPSSEITKEVQAPEGGPREKMTYELQGNVIQIKKMLARMEMLMSSLTKYLQEIPNTKGQDYVDELQYSDNQIDRDTLRNLDFMHESAFLMSRCLKSLRENMHIKEQYFANALHGNIIQIKKMFSWMEILMSRVTEYLLEIPHIKGQDYVQDEEQSVPLCFKSPKSIIKVDELQDNDNQIDRDTLRNLDFMHQSAFSMSRCLKSLRENMHTNMHTKEQDFVDELQNNYNQMERDTLRYLDFMHQYEFLTSRYI